MSDFLTNLIARSQGTADVIQPRLPSLMEPYRGGTGVLGAMPSLAAQGINRRSQDETGEGNDPNSSMGDQRVNPLHRPLPGPSQRETAFRNPFASTRHGIEPSMPPDSNSPSMAPMNAMGTAPRPGEAGAESLNSQIRAARSGNDDAPRMIAPLTHAVRQPAALRLNVAKASPRARDAASPEPAIQVTIGRVEVRAVFAEAPARRNPAPRTRPTVSLDDYLRRGEGGQR